MKRIVYQLLEQNRVTAILGNINDQLSEEEIVQRKIEAINAIVAYAFICEPRQPCKRPAKQLTKKQQPEQQKLQNTSANKAITSAAVLSSRPILPKPASPLAELPATPPPPYTPRDQNQSGGQPFIRKRRRAEPGPCIFCGKKYTRTSSLWDHLEEHLKRVKGGWVKCPACSIVCKTTEAFMAHCARAHHSCFRPSARVKIIRRSSDVTEHNCV